MMKALAAIPPGWILHGVTAYQFPGIYFHPAVRHFRKKSSR